MKKNAVRLCVVPFYFACGGWLRPPCGGLWLVYAQLWLYRSAVFMLILWVTGTRF